MQKKRQLNTKIIFLFIALIFLVSLGKPAFAHEVPNFPSCVSPLGTAIAQNNDGVHGIVGRTEQFTGSDVVFSVTPDTLIQCLCPPDGNGIQTNWWKASVLSDNELKNLQAQGWIFVPDGSLWGLEQAPYLAQNTTFSCFGGSGGGGGGSGGGSGGSGGGSSSSSSTPFGEVLGLASTGNIAFIYLLIGIGLTLTTLGLLLKKFRN